MSIQIKVNRQNKWGTQAYETIAIEEAFALYEGGLYKLLQEELGVITDEVNRNKEYATYLRQLTKKCEDLGIKPLKKGE